MQLHNDENMRADRVHRPASAGTNGTRNIAGPMPPARIKVPDFLEKDRAMHVFSSEETLASVLTLPQGFALRSGR